MYFIYWFSPFIALCLWFLRCKLNWYCFSWENMVPKRWCRRNKNTSCSNHRRMLTQCKTQWKINNDRLNDFQNILIYKEKLAATLIICIEYLHCKQCKRLNWTGFCLNIVWIICPELIYTCTKKTHFLVSTFVFGVHSSKQNAHYAHLQGSGSWKMGLYGPIRK